MEKIIILEDDKGLREELALFLRNNGYEVFEVTDFSKSIDNILNSGADLVLLDINLPFYDGEYILKEVRKVSSIPIIMVTSKDTDIDELISIGNGADDYVTKPFNTQVLLAHIGMVLKRSGKKEESVLIDAGDFALNTKEGYIKRGDKEIELTKNERKILEYLLKHRSEIVSRDDLMDFLWDNNDFVDDNTLTVNITRVRNKLKDLGLADVILTKRGEGYIIRWVLKDF